MPKLSSSNVTRPRARSAPTRDSDRAAEDILYLSPGACERLADYDEIVVERPQVLLTDASEYQEAARTDLHALSGYLREAVIDAAISEGYYVVDRAGPGVLQMRLVIADLNLKPKRPSLLASPIRHWLTAKTSGSNPLMRKCDVIQLRFQAEILDSRSRDLLASLAAVRGDRAQPVGWRTLDEDIERFATQLLCRSAAHRPSETESWASSMPKGLDLRPGG